MNKNLQQALGAALRYTHAAIIINHREIDIVPAVSEQAALEYLRNRAECWEDSGAVVGLDRRTASLEQLNWLFSDGDPTHECMVTIGTFESSYVQPSLLHTSDWRWRESDGCLVAGADEEYILLPGSTVAVKPEHRALIAAAPDLCAACEAVLVQWGLSHSADEFAGSLEKLIPRILAAVEKARRTGGDATGYSTLQVRCTRCGQVYQVEVRRENLGGYTPNGDGTHRTQVGECTECLRQEFPVKRPSPGLIAIAEEREPTEEEVRELLPRLVDDTGEWGHYDLTWEQVAVLTKKGLIRYCGHCTRNTINDCAEDASGGYTAAEYHAARANMDVDDIDTYLAMILNEGRAV